MRRVNKRWLIVSAILIVAMVSAYWLYPFGKGELQPHKEGAYPRFDKEMAFKHIVELSSQEYEGRRPGTEGNHKATNYIAERFREYGLSPGGVGGSYLQHFNLDTIIYNSEIILQVVDKNNNVVENFRYRYDFVDNNNGEDVYFDVKSPIETLTSRDDLSKLNIKNKVLVSDGSGGFSIDKIQDIDLLLFTRPKGKDITPMYIKSGVVPLYPVGVDHLFITPETYRRIEKYNKDGYYIRAFADISYPRVEVDNVVGILRADEETEDTLIITAHFDHIGKDPDGSINWGAVDNASGTGMMLEIARVMASHKDRPPFNIIFIAFNGEESGLLGSYHYVKKMSHNTERLKVINLDMIGYKDAEYLEISTISTYEGTLLNEMENIAKELKIVNQVNKGQGASDHAPFVEVGVDAILLLHFSQDCFDRFYHNPMDVIDNIDKDKLEEVGKMIIKYIIDCSKSNLITETGSLPVFCAA